MLYQEYMWFMNAVLQTQAFKCTHTHIHARAHTHTQRLTSSAGLLILAMYGGHVEAACHS